MSKKQPVEQKKQTLKFQNEIIGILIIGFASFILLALLSYSPTDISFTHYVASAATTNNIFGTFGSHSADFLLYVFGFTSYLFPFFLFFIATKQLVKSEMTFGAIFWGGAAGMILSGTLLLALVISKLSNMHGGGIVGDFLSSLCVSYFNVGGTAIIATVVMMVSMIVVINFSFLMVAKMSFYLLVKGAYIARRKAGLAWRQFKDRQPPAQDIYIVDSAPAPEKKVQPAKKIPPQERFDFYCKDGSYILPSLDLLDNIERKDEKIKKEYLIANSKILEKKLADFGITIKVTEVRPGPVVTTYEIEPAPGVKINRITSLADDLALALRAKSVRIIAPISGRGTIGIELPNHHRESVCLKKVLEKDVFQNSKSRIAIALGEDIIGMPVVTELEKMPHLLIAGTTGSGKSVSLNAMICSILFKASPDEVKFLMVDPKRLELSSYDGIPHLLHPVVTDPKEAALVLRWAVEEMERRYKLISGTNARNIESYNKLVEKSSATNKKQYQTEVQTDNNGEAMAKLPYIVVVIDELADLMMVAQRNVETSLARLAQMARASGIHIILATQRPSVDVITGVIKANFSTRISFHVSTKIDSRTILDQSGAESLLGAGDMLFMLSGRAELTRIHGAFVSDKEIERIVTHIKNQKTPIYDTSILEERISELKDETAGDTDARHDEALELAFKRGEISISLIQRHLKVGYNRAARIVEKMEEDGIVGAADGSKQRKVVPRR